MARTFRELASGNVEVEELLRSCFKDFGALEMSICSVLLEEYASGRELRGAELLRDLAKTFADPVGGLDLEDMFDHVLWLALDRSRTPLPLKQRSPVYSFARQQDRELVFA